MPRAVLALVLSGCVTTAGIVERDQVSFPLLAGATAGDLLVSGLAAGADGFTTAASIGTALAITAVDVAVGCLIGACHSLRL